MLTNRGMLDDGQASDILADHKTTGKDPVDLLVEYGLFNTQDDFWALVAEEIGAEHYDLTTFEPSKEVLQMIPAGMARLCGALPVQLGPDGLYVALTDPLNPQLLEDLRFGLGKPIIPVVARQQQVQALIDKNYGSGTQSIQDIFGQLGVTSKPGDRASIEAEANSAPIVRFVDLVLEQAIKEQASDIHFEPFEHEFKIRYRVDGSLYEMAPPPVHLAMSVISRIKVMSNMNIAERRVPQDGRIMTVVDNRPVDMRVSTLPTQYGESVVLRVLDRSSVNLSLTA
ncbi:MAG: GspE/PulE family protein, partial [Verrucomicrobium sp.]